MPSNSLKRKRTNPLDYLADLKGRLPAAKADSVATVALVEDVVCRATRDSVFLGGVAEDENADVHKAAVHLWNEVLRIERETVHPDRDFSAAYRRVLVACRVLVLRSMDDVIDPAGRMAPYLLDIALRAARACLDLAADEDAQGKGKVNGKDKGKQGDGTGVQLARVALDKARLYHDAAMAHHETAEDDDEFVQNNKRTQRLGHRRAIAELSLLWREERVGDADKVYNEVFGSGTDATTVPDVDTHDELAYALYDVGKALLADKKCGEAAVWFDRAIAASPPSKSEAGERQRIAVMIGRAMAGVGAETQDGYDRAKALTEELVGLLGSVDEDVRCRIQLLQLELYASPLAGSFDADSYAAVVLAMSKYLGTSDAECQLLHHHTQKLHSKSPALGCKVLDEWMLALRRRTDATVATDWMEKLVITRVWLLANQRETPADLDTAQTVFAKLRMPLSADAAAAAQTLMWKRVEQAYEQKEHAMAMRWCRLALSHTFDNAGRTNRPLLERKLILCAVESGELQAAKTAYANMSEAARDEPLTKYLVYKLAIQLNDIALGAECLRYISLAAEKRELLHACVLQARNAKRPNFAVQALKKLADSINQGGYEADPANPVYTPAVFRCTILMLRDIIEGTVSEDGACENRVDADDADGSQAKEQAVRDLVDILHGALDAMEMDRNCHTDAKDLLFTPDEVDWLARAAYNFGVKYSGVWDMRHTVAVLDACVKISAYLDPKELDKSRIPSKRLVCRFMMASALTALARAGMPEETDDGQQPGALPEQVLKDYQAMREHVQVFRTDLLQLHAPTRDETRDFADKLPVLMAFDFEGAVRLGDWDELEAICERAASMPKPKPGDGDATRNTDTLRALGDILLQAQPTVPSAEFVATMRVIVNKLQAGGFGSEQLLQYYRSLFQAALYRDNGAAFDVLDEVLRLSPDAEARSTELQYMAIVSFNEGLDWFAAGNEDMARQWVAAALRLADRCDDKGKLRGVMDGRLAMVGLDAQVVPSVEADPDHQDDDETMDLDLSLADVDEEMDHMLERELERELARDKEEQPQHHEQPNKGMQQKRTTPTLSSPCIAQTAAPVLMPIDV